MKEDRREDMFQDVTEDAMFVGFWCDTIKVKLPMGIFGTWGKTIMLAPIQSKKFRLLICCLKT
jgi:hypothetical protein